MLFEIGILPLLLGAIFTAILTPFAIVIANKFKLVDDPRTHKHPAILHKKIIPRAGGLPMYGGLLFGSVVLFWPLNPTLNAILLAGAVTVLIGLIDDRFDLSPYVRFGMNILCALIVVTMGITVPFVTHPLGGILSFDDNIIPFLPQILAIIWIVWVMNMLNWSKGVDGQMPGIAAISALVIGIAALRFETLDAQNIMTAQLSFLLAGIALGYLPFNFFGKTLPGYSSTILGFTIATLSILSGVKLATAILVMGVPMVDAAVAIIRRLASKKSPFWHDREHLHHLLLDKGYTPHSIAIMYWIFSSVLGAIALSLSSKGKLFAIILVIIVVIAVILFLRRALKKEEEDD